MTQPSPQQMMTCDRTGKICYRSPQDANCVAARMRTRTRDKAGKTARRRKHPAHAYPCQVCHHWHLTSTPRSRP